MEPQLYRCGNLGPEVDVAYKDQMLQWSRNFIVAEITVSPVGVEVSISLQWSRNFIVAEIASPCMSPFFLKISLQWSRNFIVAEIDCRISQCSHDMDASMGPQLYRCGNLPPAQSFIDRIVASMEPQLYRCGNRSRSQTPDQKRLALQWSRNFIVAEITRHTLRECGARRFNGAATLSLRKYPACADCRIRSGDRFNGAATLSLRK